MKSAVQHEAFTNALSIARSLNVNTITISKYNYKPDTITDERKIITADLDKAFEIFLQLRKSLSYGEDIAFHSSVNVDRHVLRNAGHKVGSAAGPSLRREIPLIDCSTDNFELVRASLMEIMQERSFKKADVFFSGQSYHIYIHALLSRYAWNKFMGRLLLINKTTQPAIIDTRWIGHRLLAGYSALRVTNNGKSYSFAPKHIETIEF